MILPELPVGLGLPRAHLERSEYNSHFVARVLRKSAGMYGNLLSYEHQPQRPRAFMFLGYSY